MSVTVTLADCVQWLTDHAARIAAGEAQAFDSCVTDPPYHLTSIVKRFGGANAAAAKDRDGLYQRAARGFIGKQWDGGDVAFRPETWRAVFDCLKPGAHLVAFSGTRTYHRMACAIEDAGFEVRDQLAWTYGSGFPKSHNVGGGRGTALKPAWEPICLARKPIAEKSVAAQVLATGTGALNIDACRVQYEGAADREAAQVGGRATGKPLSALQGKDDARAAFTPSDNSAGRWPANIAHDDSEAVLAGFPYTASGGGPAIGTERTQQAVYGAPNANQSAPLGFNEGSAARFFYSAKAGPLDRLGSAHATVKPVDLMRWLVRMVTPPAGHVLEPFAGSGTTGIAAMAEGMACTMLELEADHVADIERKLAHLRGHGRHTLIEHNRRPARPAPGSAGALLDLLEGKD